MRKSRFTTEQIVGILKEQEAGAMISELCRRQGIVSRCLREAPTAAYSQLRAIRLAAGEWGKSDKAWWA